MRVGIIGAGISGLSAALALRKAGHTVDVFQREPYLDGRVATVELAGARVAPFPNFLHRSDIAFFRLCQELHLSERLRFHEASIGFFHNGRSYDLNTPLDVLLFPEIPLWQRVRLGNFVRKVRSQTSRPALDGVSAKSWLVGQTGERAYEVFWKPLLEQKFGVHCDTISAAWVWQRIRRHARSRGKFGYLQGGNGGLLDALYTRLDAEGVRVHPERPVRGILAESDRVVGLCFDSADDYHCERIVSTVSLCTLAGLLPPGWDSYAAALRRVPYTGVVCVSFALRKRVMRHFWSGVNDVRTPVKGVVAYTNLDPMPEHDFHVVYVPYGVSADDPFSSMADIEVVEQAWEALTVMNPALTAADRIESHVAREPHAHATYRTDFLDLLPSHESPLKGLRLLDSALLYPNGRTPASEVANALECAARIEEG